MTASAEPLVVGDLAKPVYTLSGTGLPNDSGITVVVAVTRPDGTTVTPAPTVSHDGSFTWSATFPVNQPGTWLYTFTASGAAQDVTDGQFFVRGPAAANVYCTVGEVRAQVKDDDGRLDQTLLERAVNATSRAIDDYCSGGVPGSRRFWQDPAPVARTFRVDQPDFAWVDDISTTTGLIVRTDENGDGTFETTWAAGTDYQLEPLNANANGEPYAFWQLTAIGTRAFPLYPHRAALQVTARFGWSAIPDQVNEAAILKAVKLFKRKDSPDGFASGFTDFGPVRISRYEDPDVVMLLERFMKRRTRTLNYTPQRYSLFHGGR